MQVKGRPLWPGAGRNRRVDCRAEEQGEGRASLPSGFLPGSRLAAVPATMGHLLSTSGAGGGGCQAGSSPQTPIPPWLAGCCSWPTAARKPGQRRVKAARSLPSAPSPLESPRNDVSTPQLKKEFNYRDRLWELEQTRSVGGAGKQLRSERARLAAPRGARAPGSGGGERPPGVGKVKEIRGIGVLFGKKRLFSQPRAPRPRDGAFGRSRSRGGGVGGRGRGATRRGGTTGAGLAGLRAGKTARPLRVPFPLASPPPLLHPSPVPPAELPEPARVKDQPALFLGWRNQKPK